MAKNIKTNDVTMSPQEASEWVNANYSKDINPSSISYLIQYGQVRKVVEDGSTKVYLSDIKKYYSTQNNKESRLKETLGQDLDWHLSFDNIKESERTKHVHRIHPYKGKFIPQLVEYFLDSHTDEYKDQIYFQSGDIVLDPFCGSGTTLVQANELGMFAIGVDVSEFNSLISNTKVGNHNLFELHDEIRRITIALKNYVAENEWNVFEEELKNVLSIFNKEYFPSPEYVYKVRNGDIDERSYSVDKEIKFLSIFKKLTKKYKIKVIQEESNSSFLGKWFLYPVRKEIDYVRQLINQSQNENTRNLLSVILSRTARSSRATTHGDLATLIDPVVTSYYCHKHYKICKPLFSMVTWWDFYSKDTLKRLGEFDKLRTNTSQYCITGDSRNINIIDCLKEVDPSLATLAKNKKIKGVFSSPPYVGLIDYHEQHAYAYELFDYQRRDDFEIGPLYKGKGKEAQKSYVEGISQVLNNSKKYLHDDYNVFLVANDSFNLYPDIANKSGMKIVKEFKRPVLNRTEKDKSAYSEKIFHLKEA